MEPSNENVKNQLKNYLSKRGVKNIWIANAIDISPTSICLFLKGKRELPADKLQIICSIIEEKYQF